MDSPDKGFVTQRACPCHDIDVAEDNGFSLSWFWLWFFHAQVLLSCDGGRAWKCVPHYWPFVRGIVRSVANFTFKSQWCGSLNVYSIVRMNKLQIIWEGLTPMWRHCNGFSGTLYGVIRMPSHKLYYTDITLDSATIAVMCHVCMDSHSCYIFRI